MAKEYHVGRLIDHVHLKVRDLAASRKFYDAALGALGLPLTEGGPSISTWTRSSSAWPSRRKSR